MTFYSIEKFFIADVGDVVPIYKDGVPEKNLKRLKKYLSIKIQTMVIIIMI